MVWFAEDRAVLLLCFCWLYGCSEITTKPTVSSLDTRLNIRESSAFSVISLDEEGLVSASVFKSIEGPDDRCNPQDCKPGISWGEKYASQSVGVVVNRIPKEHLQAEGYKLPVEYDALCGPEKVKNSGQRPERFHDEPTIGVGTAFRISGKHLGKDWGGDLVATSHHVIHNEKECAAASVVFNYRYPHESNSIRKAIEGPTKVRKADVYNCEEVLHDSDNDSDWVIFRTDRPISNDIKMISLEPPSDDELVVGAAITMLGHPYGLPLKITRNGELVGWDSKSRDVSMRLDAMPLNSGSPLFLQESLKKEGSIPRAFGILSQGDNKRFAENKPGGCILTYRCKDSQDCADNHKGRLAPKIRDVG